MANRVFSSPGMGEQDPLILEVEPLRPIPSNFRHVLSSSNLKRDEDPPEQQEALPTSRFGQLGYLSLWIPKLDPSQPEARASRAWSSNRRNMLILQQTLAAVVFGINVGCTSWAYAKYKTSGGIGTLYKGDCTTAKMINQWSHLAINALSTLLLGSSNYCMQLLVAPTRSEVNEAHKRSIWLDIGTSSFHNLKWIPKKSVLTWCSLGLSSAFLHLFWNSAVFASIPAYKYTAAFTTQDYLQHNQSWSATDLDYIRLGIPTYERLNNSECIDRYVNSLKNGKDLIVVTNKTSSTNGGHAFLGSYTLVNWPRQGVWICASPEIYSGLGAGGCTSGYMKDYANNWTVVYGGVGDYSATEHRETVTALYCLSAGTQPSDQGCGLHFSVPIMAVVCVLNFIKCLSICWTACHNWNAQRMCITGDAIASFLQCPDRCTEGMSTASRYEFHKGGPWKSKSRKWRPRSLRWYRAASPRRWVIVLSLCTTALAIVSFLLSLAIAERHRDNAHTSLPALWHEGLGAVNDHEIIGHSVPGNPMAQFLESVLVANSPQLLFSFLYYLYNGLLTCMLAAEEHSHYGIARKALRVSAPQGYQRSSWFLSLPYRYGIPQTLASGLLHWFISQALFLVRVVMYEENGGGAGSDAVSRVGFSPIGIVMAFTLATVLVLVLVALGLLCQYPGGKRAVPLMGTSSAAISAACHPPEEDKDAYLLPVRWGVVGVDENGAGQCAYTTALDVRPPREGAVYR